MDGWAGSIEYPMLETHSLPDEGCFEYWNVNKASSLEYGA